MAYIQPRAFATGDIVGRSNVGVLLDNDNHFNGLADRYRVPVHAPTLSARAGRTSEIMWIGHHYMTPTAKTGVYHVEIRTGSYPVTWRLMYGGIAMLGPRTTAAGLCVPAIGPLQ